MRGTDWAIGGRRALGVELGMELGVELGAMPWVTRRIESHMSFARLLTKQAEPSARECRESIASPVSSITPRRVITGET